MRLAGLWVLLLLAPAVPAQIVADQFGFQMESSLGTAGVLCVGSDCVPRQGDAPRGESIELVVRAPLGAPFAIGFGPGASGCLQLPFAVHPLVLDHPVFILVSGVVDLPDTILACHGGIARRSVPIPVEVPLGAQVGLQAVALVDTPYGPLPALSVAILATAR